MKAVLQFLKTHPVLLVGYPVDLAIATAFMLSITPGEGEWVRAAFVALGFLIVTVKLFLAADRTVVSTVLCVIAMTLNAYAEASFFVTHAAPGAVVRETIEIKSAKQEVQKWQSLVDLDRDEIKRATAERRRTDIATILTPQLDKDQLALNTATVALQSAISSELTHTPDAIEVFERPWRLLEQPTTGKIALLIFGLLSSLFLEGVLFRSMRGRKMITESVTVTTEDVQVEVRPIPVPILMYPKGNDGTPLPPAIAAKRLNVDFSTALNLYHKTLDTSNGSMVQSASKVSKK